MSNAAEKARYFLEKSTPQLHSLKTLGIFTDEEIKTLVSTRSEHEHIVLSSGSSPSQWLSYIDWDVSLENLRLRRCRKLHVHNSSSHVGEARIFKTFERAVERHPASLELWERYLDFAEEKTSAAGRKWNTVWNRAVRLHSRNAGLWIRGAMKMAEHGDMNKARERFMYGCRNCVGGGKDGGEAAKVWTQYAKAELEWLARTEKKLKLGKYSVDHVEGDYMDLGGGGDNDSDSDKEDEDDEDEDELAPPTREQRTAIQEAASKELAKSSALEGAIPRAVFDVARKQDFFSPRVAMMFWDAFSKVKEASRRISILHHVLAAMEKSYPCSPETAFCRIRMPLVGVKGVVSWGNGLKEVLRRLGAAFKDTGDADALANLVCPWLDSLISHEGQEPFDTVLQQTRNRISSSLEN
ncbi:hypothetical protein MKZ38_000326 [Zalerion maritima]|uniref:U3 small nucleolar RNA-associated protein 6 N-terminal domain-containing protein n=1 Tax=Zalerion maritima TaxID=339359 RepID=A0AAD5WMP3_9PEZI|nr:hypothetical protein MKZ38_000326 [Zalerion maritima]